MTSYPPDSAGVPFDAAVHQARRDGTPRTTTAGRYFLKSRVNVVAAKARAASAAPPAAPVTHGPATAAQILGADGLTGLMDSAPAVTVPLAPPGDGPATAPDSAPDSAPPTAPGATLSESIVGTAPAPTGTPDEIRGTAMFLTRLYESLTCGLIDGPEWALPAPDRELLTGAIEEDMRASGAVALTPRQRLFATVLAVSGPNLSKPRTAAKLAGWWAGLKKLMGFGPVPPAPLDSKPVPSAPHEKDPHA